jgi:hypothetical protein
VREKTREEESERERESEREAEIQRDRERYRETATKRKKERKAESESEKRGERRERVNRRGKRGKYRRGFVSFSLPYHSSAFRCDRLPPRFHSLCHTRSLRLAHLSRRDRYRLDGCYLCLFLASL